MQNYLYLDSTNLSANRTYNYIIEAIYQDPLYGYIPQHLAIKTAQLDSEQQAYFNTGVPTDVELNLKLLQALKNFISRAEDASYTLKLALFECDSLELISHLVEIADKATVELIIDARPYNKHSLAALEDYEDELNIVYRDIDGIDYGHNKFIVLCQHDMPQAVWTGSVNWSHYALFGQWNNGHVVNNPQIATMYHEYWLALKDGADKSELISRNSRENYTYQDTEVVFSPRTTAIVDRYNSYIENAETSVYLTVPFGLCEDFAGAWNDEDATATKYLLLDNLGTLYNRKDITTSMKLPNHFQALGDLLSQDVPLIGAEHLLPDHKLIRFIHAKIMLIDPLQSNSKIITGSANFSSNSVALNEENMLIITNKPGLAIDYWLQFMRVFLHYSLINSIHYALSHKTSLPFQLQGVRSNVWTNQIDSLTVELVKEVEKACLEL